MLQRFAVLSSFLFWFVELYTVYMESIIRAEEYHCKVYIE